MDNITLTELFFVITGIAVIIITVLLTIALIYIISFVRTARAVIRTAKRTADFVSEDIGELRKNIKEKGVNAGSLIQFAKNLGKKGKAKK